MGQGIDLERVRTLKEAELRRFVAERPRSAALQERARASMPGGVPSTWLADLNFPHPPVWVTDAQGARLRAVDDHEYIDPFVRDPVASDLDLIHGDPPVLFR